MGTPVSAVTFGDVLDDLVAGALRSEIPEEGARQARVATERAIGVHPAQVATRHISRRAEAYFSACVHKMVVRGSAGPRATARLVAAAIVADLQEAGRDAEAIWTELERGWSAQLPVEVLEEYRLRLCG